MPLKIAALKATHTHPCTVQSVFASCMWYATFGFCHACPFFLPGGVQYTPHTVRYPGQSTLPLCTVTCWGLLLIPDINVPHSNCARLT